jgi:hypothetical protein
LYALQGLPIGFFLSSIPVIFKKYLTYSEIGVIMMCTMPFSLKVLWSPFVEFYYSEKFGKRRSWIVPMQLILCGLLFLLKDNLENWLVDRQVSLVSYLLTGVIFVITCQDIAVDSWAIEMLHPANATYGSSSQSIGHRIGVFFSSTLFISMNSPEFCKRWFGKNELWTLKGFLEAYCWLTLAVTLYIVIFVPEKDAEILKLQAEKDEKKEDEVTMSMTFSIFKDVLMNKSV